MGVTFTTNIGLAKPDEAELASDWLATAGDRLYEDNNTIIQDKMNLAMTAYSPTLVGQTANPNVGTGFRDGEYVIIDEAWVYGNFVIEFFDAGISAGTGEYGISLPFVADGLYHNVGNGLNNPIGGNDCIGEGYLWDNSSVGASGSCALDVVTVSGTSYARLCTETHASKTLRVFGGGSHFSVATNDKFTGSFFYKRSL